MYQFRCSSLVHVDCVCVAVKITNAAAVRYLIAVYCWSAAHVYQRNDNPTLDAVVIAFCIRHVSLKLHCARQHCTTLSCALFVRRASQL